MPINVPPAVNFPDPLVALPTRYLQDPVEGAKFIHCEVDWGSMGGASKCVNFNLQNNATLAFSQIVALAVDNSGCGADVEFVFPDSAETLSIPAYSPKVIVEVFTNQRQFYLQAPNAQSEDVTNFSIHNTLPPPIAVPTSQEQEFANVGSISGDATSNTAIIPAGINGSLETANILFYTGTVSGGATWELIDGNNNVLAAGIAAASSISTSIILDLQSVRVRFQNGLYFKIIATSFTGGAIFSINLYYRTP